MKLLQRAELEEQYKNDGLRNNYGMRLKVSCLRIYQAYIWLLFLKNNNAGYSLNIIQAIHSSQNCTLSHYRTMHHLEALAERCCIDQKQKQNALLKWWIYQYTAECIATYWHIKYWTTNIKNKISIHCIISLIVSILFKTFQ